MKKKTPTRHTATPKLSPAPKAAVAAVETPVVAAVAAATPVVKAVTATVAPAVAAVATPVVAVKAAPVELIAQLRDESAERGVEAAEALAKTADVRAIEPLLEVLANTDGYCHVVVRAAAAMALGHFQDARVVSALTAAATDTMAEVSREAVLALGELKATSAAATLTDIAANNDGYYLNVVRHAAVRSLGRMKATAAKATLTAIADSAFEDAALTSAAREALGQL